MAIGEPIVVFDAADPDAVSAFWAGVLGGTVEPDGDWRKVLVDGVERVGVQFAPDHQQPDWPDGPEQQVHLDFFPDDVDAEHERVLALGGRLLQQGDRTASHGFTVYADPAGHPFCLCWA
jgi:predicted enzyme related to lactoylglutathione lyase